MISHDFLLIIKTDAQFMFTTLPHSMHAKHKILVQLNILSSDKSWALTFAKVFGKSEVPIYFYKNFPIHCSRDLTLVYFGGASKDFHAVLAACDLLLSNYTPLIGEEVF